MRRVWNQRPPRAVRTASWPEAPSRPEQPPPQAFGAVAAFEREDRSATFGRVPRCLPAPEVTERGARCKRAEGFRTHRAPAAPATGALVHALPRRSARRCTCSRSAAVGGAHVPTAQRRGVRAPVFKAMRGRFTRYRARIGGRLTRYRCAPAGGSARAGADGSATGRAEPTAGGVVSGAGTTAATSAGVLGGSARTSAASGASASAGGRAQHAAGGVGTIADASARGGARAGAVGCPHRRCAKCDGLEPRRCPRPTQPAGASEATPLTSAARSAGARKTPRSSGALSRLSARRFVRARGGERQRAAGQASARSARSARRRQGLQWKSRAARLERKARRRSGSPKSFVPRWARRAGICTTITATMVVVGIGTIVVTTGIAIDITIIGAAITGVVTGTRGASSVVVRTW